MRLISIKIRNKVVSALNAEKVSFIALEGTAVKVIIDGQNMVFNHPSVEDAERQFDNLFKVMLDINKGL